MLKKNSILVSQGTQFHTRYQGDYRGTLSVILKELFLVLDFWGSQGPHLGVSVSVMTFLSSDNSLADNTEL